MGREDFILYVPRNANGEDRTTFNVRDTRLGIAIEGSALNGWTPRGRFETDFYGSDPSSNGQLRIRLAYTEFEKEGTLIRVGQDWNQIAALNPSTLDFGIMGYNGNLWNRIPQVTLMQKLGAGFEGLVTVYRGKWTDDDSGSKVDTQINMPWIGGKVSYTVPLFGEQKSYFALGGAIRNGEAGDNDVTPYVAALEVKIPISIVEIMGEAYMGQGLGFEYFHNGVVNSTTPSLSTYGAFNAKGHAIMTSGGWLQASVKPIKDVTVNVGYGLDNPKDADVRNNAKPEEPFFFQQSQYAFGNVFIQLFKDISVGIEAAHLNTDWATGDNHGTRYQTSLIYNW
jgi:hypothetical protein